MASNGRSALQLAQTVAGPPHLIQYFYDGDWHAQPFPLARPFPEWHRGLGTTYHESGTLWMGTDSAASVTDPLGRFHHVSNAYCCDQAIFPTVGSVNPVLTGLRWRTASPKRFRFEQSASRPTGDLKPGQRKDATCAWPRTTWRTCSIGPGR